MRKVV
jgi:hypothetical protein